MNQKIYREGNLIKLIDQNNNILVSESAVQVRISKSTLTSTSYTIDSDDIGVINIDFANLLQKDGSAFPSLAFFDKWVAANTGDQSARISEEADVSFDAVTVSKSVAIKMLDADPLRLGATFTNRGQKDIYIRFKAATTDNDIEGRELKAGESFDMPFGYVGEVSAIRTDETGTQTSIIEIMNW